MDPFRLRKYFGAIVFGKEDMVDCGGYLDAEPFGELFVLDREILEFVLFTDLSEELCKAVCNSRIISTSLAVKRRK